jgi:hypothetical protein
MARAPATVLAALAIALAGCGLVGIPGLGPGMSRPAPIEVPDASEMPPTLIAPVISDEAMERAVGGGGAGGGARRGGPAGSAGDIRTGTSRSPRD